MARATKPPKRNSWANAAAGSPDIEESALVDTGWTPAGVIPSRGEFNFEQNRYDEAANYLMQRGITDWASDETDYDVGDIVRGSDNTFYQLIGTATPGTAPTADTGNWYACLRPPHALLTETEADLIQLPFRNANGFMISGKDHRGFDAGRIMNFRENWTDGGAATRTATAAKAHWFGPWSTGIDNSGGLAGTGISLPGPYDPDLTTRPRGSLLLVNAFGQSVNAVSIVETSRPIIKMSQASMCLEFAFSLNGASGPQGTSGFSVGLGDGTLAANRTLSGPADDALAYGAWIEAFPGQANYLVASKPQGGSVTYEDTGIAVARDAPQLYRCVVVGTSDSDDGAARVFHIMNGLEVANHAVSLQNRLLSPYIRTFGNAGEVCEIAVGPMRAQARLVFGNQSVI